jgi:hypothetical protein
MIHQIMSELDDLRGNALRPVPIAVAERRVRIRQILPQKMTGDDCECGSDALFQVIHALRRVGVSRGGKAHWSVKKARHLLRFAVAIGSGFIQTVIEGEKNRSPWCC